MNACKSRYGVIGSVTALAVIAVGCGSSSNSSGSASPVTFAQITALTGSNSFEQGFTAAGGYPSIYAINQAGGILGHHVDISFIDTRSDPADAVTAVERFLATNSNVIGFQGPDTTSSPTVVPILESSGQTMFSSGGQSTWDHTTDTYFWRIISPDAANGEAMALWAKRQGYQRVAAVFGTDTSSQGDLGGILSGVQTSGLDLVANIGLTPDQPSYRSDVARLVAANPQVIMTESDGATGATFFGELKQLGALTPTLGTAATGVSAYNLPVSGAFGASEFQSLFRVVAGGSPQPNAATAALNSALTQVSSQLPPPLNQWENNSFINAFWDGYMIEALAAQASGSIDPKVYNAWIPKITSPGSGKTDVYTFAAGKAALAAGKQIRYIGASGPIIFDQWHSFFGDQIVQSYGTGGALQLVGTVTAAELEAH